MAAAEMQHLLEGIEAVATHPCDWERGGRYEPLTNEVVFAKEVKHRKEKIEDRLSI